MDERDALLGQAIRRVVEIAARDPVLRGGLIELAHVIEAIAGDEGSVPAADSEDMGMANVAIETIDEPVDPSGDDGPPLKASIAALLSAVTGEVGGDDSPFAIAMRRAAGLPDPVSVATESAPEATASTPTTDAAAQRTAASDPDAILAGIAERVRAKALLTARIAESGAGADPSRAALVHRVRSVGSSPWVADLVEPDPARIRDLATSYAALADVAEATRFVRAHHPNDTRLSEKVVRSLAAVQSALRVAVERLRPTPDEDQLAAFEWLRTTTARERIYVERHMRLGDPLDPAEAPAVAEAVRAELRELEDAERRREDRASGLKKVTYHAGRVAKGRGTEHDVAKIVTAVNDLVRDGLPPSNLDLRALLLPIVDELPPPAEDQAAYGRLLEDLRLHQERSRQPAGKRAEIGQAPSDDVRRAAALLRGREVVLIGGERRVDAERALTEAFGLSELTWFTLSDNPTLDELERAIARPRVAVVIQLIRWSRHRHGEADELAQRHDKPFVRVPAGYNANAIARAVLDQASERLSGDAT